MKDAFEINSSFPLALLCAYVLAHYLYATEFQKALEQCAFLVLCVIQRHCTTSLNMSSTSNKH